MFPTIPFNLILDDLRRTQSPEITAENILEGNFLCPNNVRNLCFNLNLSCSLIFSASHCSSKDERYFSIVFSLVLFFKAEGLVIHL